MHRIWDKFIVFFYCVFVRHLFGAAVAVSDKVEEIVRLVMLGEEKQE